MAKNKLRKDSDFKKLAKDLYKYRKTLDNFDKENIIYEIVKNKIKNKHFYRLEKDGLGPWTGFHENGKDHNEIWTESSFRLGLTRRDSYCSDVWAIEKKKFIHACYSLKNLKSWFSKNEWKKLKKMGYEVKKYKIGENFEDIFFADNQVLLLKKKKDRNKVLKKLKRKMKKESKAFDEIIELL